MPAPQYPYDPLGTNPLNRIPNERRTITVSNGINGFLMKPSAAPFFGDSLVIINAAGTPLTENVDYYLTHPWAIGKNHTTKDLYGSITLLGGYPVGTYTLVYRTIGGTYVGNSDIVIEDALVASPSDYLTVDWSTAPTYFPSAPHGHDLNSTFEMIELYHALMAIANSISSNDGQIHVDDVIDMETFWMNGSLNPMLNLAETVGKLNEANTAMLLQLLTIIEPFRKNLNIPNGLKNITINLGGGLLIKLGSVEIPNTVEAGTISLAKPYFVNECFYFSGTINKVTPGIIRDNIYFDGPTNNVVSYEIDYHAPKASGNRVIKFIAIGR